MVFGFWSNASSNNDEDDPEKYYEMRTIKSSLKTSNGVTPTTATEKIIQDVVAYQHNINMEGWLNCHPISSKPIVPVSGIGSNFKNRYFVLNHGCLFYYKISLERSINLINFRIPTHEEPLREPLENIGESGYIFKLVSLDGIKEHNIILAAPSEQSLQQWMLSFKNVIYPHQTVTEGSDRVDPSNSSLKNGYLYIKYHNKWHKRYFSINAFSRILECSIRREKGFLTLDNADIDISFGDGFSFVIKGEKGYMTMIADEAGVRDNWISAIQRVIDEHAAERHGHVALTHNSTDEVNFANRVKEIIRHNPRNASVPLPNPGNKFFIMSIDGGGIRGVINCIILQRIEAEIPNFTKYFHFFAGCSNGGLLATSLAYGYSPSACRESLELIGSELFQVNTSVPVWKSKFTNNYLKIMTDISFGRSKISDLGDVYLSIPAYLLDNHHPEIEYRSGEIHHFHNVMPEYTDENVSEISLSDAVMRTTAAPVHFTSWQEYVDGGIFDHDPAASALTMAMSPNPRGLDIPISEIVVFSMGTGFSASYIEDKGDHHNWGYYQWIPKLPEILWHGMKSKSQFMCRSILGRAYHRLDPIIPPDIPLDDTKSLPKLIEIAKSVDISETVQWFRSMLTT